MDKSKILSEVYTFLQSNFQMVVGTFDTYPWCATVYYTSDESLHLYFLSNPETIHCKQLAIQPSVSVCIADAPQNPTSKKKGLQMYGIAEQISDKQKIMHALHLWRKTLNVTSDAYTYEGMLKKAISGRMFKITPKKIKFFNEELWGEGNEPIVEL